MKHTIQSCRSDPYNAGNDDREIIVSDTGNWFTITLTNYWKDEQSYEFNISRKAAAELAVALDVMLSESEDDPVEEPEEEVEEERKEFIVGETPLPELPYQVIGNESKTLWGAFRWHRDALDYTHRFDNGVVSIHTIHERR